MATIGDLWAAIVPAALPVAPLSAAQLAREVGWVRVLKARVPAFEALDPGDLAIIPGSALAVVAPAATEAATLVEALVAARCAGMLVIDAEDGTDGAATDGTERPGGADETDGTDAGAADETDGTDLTSAATDAISREPRRASEDRRTAGGPLGGLAAAAARVGLPALRVGRVDPNQLERSVIGYLLNRRAELEHQASLLEAGLEDVALGSGDVDALIAAVAGFLGRAVVLEDRRGESIAVHAPEAAPGAAAAVSRYLAGSRVAALRVPLPAPSAAGSEAPTGIAQRTVGGSDPSASGATASHPVGRGGSAGRLLLLGERPASELERLVGPRVGRLLALEVARSDAVRRAGDTARRADQLPSDGPPWVVLMARQVPADADGRAPLEEREAIRSRLRIVAPARRLTLRGDADSLELRLVLAAGPVDAAGSDAKPTVTNPEEASTQTDDGRAPGAETLALAARVADLLGRSVAVSRPFRDPAGRPGAEAETRATLEAIEALPDPPRVARGDRLSAYRLLAALGSLPDGARHAASLLEPLLHGTPDARRERLATVRAVLEHPGFNEAATALGVHRNTLAYRIGRIEAATGWRLGDPELRVPLLIALRLVQTDQ